MERFLIELFTRGLVLCLLTGLTLVLFRRAAAAYRHLICVLALFGLLVLPSAQRLLPPLPLLPPQSAATPQQATVPPQEAGLLSGMPSKSGMLSSPERVPEPISETKPAPLLWAGSGPAPHGVAALQPERTTKTTAFLFAIWVVGSATLLIRLMAALFRLRKLEAESRNEMLDSVPILVSDQVQSPLTWGIRRSVILLPSALLSGDPTVCESALRHEQAHIARRDWVWNLLAETVCTFFWFQPGVWWLRRRMRLESERACDDLVLLSGIAGPDYADHLLHIVRSVGINEVAPAMAQSGGMEERMKHILDTTKPRRAPRAALACAVPLGLTLLALAALRVSTRSADAQPLNARDSQVPESRRAVMVSRQSNSLLPTAAPEAPKMAEPSSSDLAQPLNGDIPTVQHSAPASEVSHRITPRQSDSPTEAALYTGPAVPVQGVVWGEAADGLQPGFLMRLPGDPAAPKVVFNSHVKYQVLVRNTTRWDRVIEVQCQDFRGTDPYLIPDGDIRQALGGSKIPANYRAIGILDERARFLGYAVKLAPGEAVVVPDGDRVNVLALYVGDAEKESYPRIEKIQQELNWIVQPVMIRSLTPTEAAEDLASMSSPYGNGINLTILQRDGRPATRLGARLAIRPGSRTLYAKGPLEIGPVNAANPPLEKPVQWGEKVRGFQLGARLVKEGSVFKAGDTIEFQAFGRNLSGKDISLTIGNYWKVNYKVQVQTLDGRSIYMERDGRNQEMLLAGYRAELLVDGVTQEISKATLKIARQPQTHRPDQTIPDPDAWVELVPLKPGRYRVRLLSWGVFGDRKSESASGWIPIEVKKD